MNDSFDKFYQFKTNKRLILRKLLSLWVNLELTKSALHTASEYTDYKYGSQTNGANGTASLNYFYWNKNQCLYVIT